MTDHWTTPEARGIYRAPESVPPLPQHHTSNDYGSRLARMEEHVNFAAHNMRRVEADSMRRAADIVGWTSSHMRSTNAAIADIDRRFREVENHMLVGTTKSRVLWGLVSGSGTFVMGLTSLLKWGSVAAVAYLLITGTITVDAAKLLLGVLGWQIGS